METAGFYNRLRYFLYTKTKLGLWYTRKQWEKAAIQYPNGHSKQTSFEYSGITVFVLPVGFDNYCYGIVNELSVDPITAERQCILVDVGDAAKALDFLKENKLILSAVLSTHKHCQIKEGDMISAGGLSVSVCSTPGHTRKHFTYLVQLPDNHQQLIFTGDFLFNAGSGRLYECAPEVQLASITKFVKLVKPADIIFPGHEYALENYKFSQWLWKRSIEKQQAKHSSEDDWKMTHDMSDYCRKVEECQLARSSLTPLVPLNIADQLKYNPFLNTADKSVQALAGVLEGEETQKRTQTFYNLFKLKDDFLAEKY